MSSIEKNLSTGSVWKRLLTFAVPFLIANMIQSLYSVADMLIVGNFSGTVSMSGVNMGSQITFIETNLTVGFCVGGTILIAQYVGANRRDDLQRVTSTLITMLLIIAAVMTVLVLFLAAPLLRLLQTPEEAFSEAYEYLLVTVSGTVFIFGYNALSAILRGMGDSRSPMIFIAIACITNILLDLLLVAQFNMGAKGAAIATVASQALSMFLCIFYLRRREFIFDFKPRSFRIHRPTANLIFKLGLPTAVQSSIIDISFLILTALVNIIGGVTASAAVGVVSKFNGFAIMPSSAMANSVSTVAAQNIGAGEWERAKRTRYIGMLVSFCAGGLVFVLVSLFPEAILRLFDDDPKMLAYGIEYFSAFRFDYMIVPFTFCTNALFVAAGHTTFALITSMVTSVFLRAPVAYLFSSVLGLGIFGVGLAIPVATLSIGFIQFWFYASGRWQHNVVTKHEQLQ